MTVNLFLEYLDTWDEVVNLIKLESGDIAGNWKLDPHYFYGCAYPYLCLNTSTHHIVFDKRKKFGVYRKLKK